MNVRRPGSNRPELPVKKHKFLRSNPRFCNIWYGAPVSHFLSSWRRAGCAFRADSVSCWWKLLSKLGSGVVSFRPPRSVLCEVAVHFNTLPNPDLLLHLPKTSFCYNFLLSSTKPNFNEQRRVTFWSLNRKICISGPCITGERFVILWA